MIQRHGEEYRLMLEARAQQLGVGGSMIFHHRFVSQAELTEFLSATDIYITPYLQPEQITSGTLAYAVGAGKAVISTPYIYARELLADGRGLLVPWRDSGAIVREVIGLISHDAERDAMCARAAAHGVGMTWPAVAAQYVDSFERARTDAAQRRRSSFRAQTLASRPAGLLEIDLRHVRAMTDDTGMLQHAAFNFPRYEDGYCVDDNARALLLMTLVDDAGTDDPALVQSLASRYLAFVSHAFEPTSGRFRNFLSYSRQWLEPYGSEDSHGRTLWALGAVVGRASNPGRQSLAGALFHAALPAVTSFTSPRAWAYVLLGIEEYLRAFQGDVVVQSLRADLADRLYGLFLRTSRPDWPWFEDSVTYCNARLSQALIVSGSRMHRDDMTEAGMRSLAWLVSLQVSADGHFAAIGSNGFYERGAAPATFDQQPVEACVTTSACLEAYRHFDESRWADQGCHAFNSWGRTTSTGGSTTLPPAAAATDCTPIAPTRTRGPRRRSLS